ncbi:LysR family transcriptional regulator [Stutzerimonas azotifigens]|uniref:LysR family transcriptional regulator n=1 Tax=Stutzerimonas azotifigens TaxID=291995 RepID=A0ABR5Z2Y6_9GAMM|nr:LysR family transcriptional regulator [Stutzerimonas azotifigens]MBA1274519.1 LysR family transcriptional regulator [Stutzerimonas azotifigens]
MDLFQAMRIFVRVADSGSFTAAAQATNLSTAQVSRLVSDLETHLQARLLQRTTRRVSLTAAGAGYLEHCKQILLEVENAGAEASGAHLTPRGRLRVHSIIGVGSQLLAPLAARYRERYPDVQLDLTLSQRLPDLLAEGHDVVITLSTGLPDSELVGQHIADMHSVVCAAPSYISVHGVPASPEQLTEHRCLRLVDPAFPEDWIFTVDGEPRAIRPQTTFQVNVAEAIALAAEAGMGICLLPDYVAARSLARGSLVRLLPEQRPHRKGIYALYPSRRYLDAKVRTWVQFLQAEIPEALEQTTAILDDPMYWAQGSDAAPR